MIPCRKYTNIQSKGCVLLPARPDPRAPPLAPTHTHAATVAHTVALTPRSRPKMCSPRSEDDRTVVDGCWTRSPSRIRNLRRQSHDTCQRGQNRAREGEGCRVQSEGSREVPMVRTPAGPLGSRTPSRGRSQRRDTGRGPAFRFTSTHIMRACWRESMRAGQREPDRGNCSRSRAMMPYNSTATRTKCSDWIVRRCHPSAHTPSGVGFSASVSPFGFCSRFARATNQRGASKECI